MLELYQVEPFIINIRAVAVYGSVWLCMAESD